MCKEERYFTQINKISIEIIKKNLWQDLSKRGLLYEFQYHLTPLVDELVCKIFNKVYYSDENFKKVPCAMVAVGGYGRKELYWHSDLDLLIIYEDLIPPFATNMARSIFTPLWDMGFDLGHGVRTIEDCITLCLKDIKTFTSLLDMRLIAGEKKVFEALLNQFQNLLSKNEEEYIIKLNQISEERSKKFTSPQHLLEPNLKEGIGGLRDYHHVLWLRKILFGLHKTPVNINSFDENDFFSEIKTHVDQIGIIRNFLHQLYKTKNDTLRMELQQKLTKSIFGNSENETNSTGKFLGELHHHMSTLRFLAESISATMINKSNFSYKNQKEVLYKDVLEINEDLTPEGIQNLIDKAAKTKGLISIDSIKLIRKFGKLIFSDTTNITNILNYIDKTITENAAYSKILLLANIGILDYAMPEFYEVKNLVQYDTYHIYPVGKHSLETLKFLCEIDKYGTIFEQTIMYEIENKKPLFWAALLHDIGKGSKSHEIVGAIKAQNLLKRGNFENTTIEEVSFLIKHHLLMAETATRKNLNEEKTIVECARTIGTPERAKMLYLLTWADSKSTGPKSWDSWVEYLVQELLIKVLHVFERGNLASKDIMATSQQNLAFAKQLLSEIIPEENFIEFFQAMGIRYSLETPPWEIKLHVEMAMELNALIKNNKSNLVISWKDYSRDGILEFTIVTVDHPGLFSKISGVLTLNGFNILSARAYTWANKIAVDVIELTYPPDPLKLQEKRQQVESDLSDALKGVLDIKQRLARKSSVIKRDSVSYKVSKDPEVIIDNSQSDFFTVVQVYAFDKIGLLYDITRVLHEHNLDIKFAKIGSKGDMVADFFYVKNILGEKLSDLQKIELLKNDILKAIL